eukprot:Hpha_TRINITY_DN16156_c7_g5::TRINITY_DN16156_c7_g5_i1::g.3519::m.3519
MCGGSERNVKVSVGEERPSTRDAPPTGEFGNVYFRFTVLFALLVIAVASLPVWTALAFGGKMGMRVSAVALGVVSLFWISVAVNALRNLGKMEYVPRSTLQGVATARQRKFRHVVIVPCYKDPLDILLKCIGSLTLQDDPASLLVVLAMEARAPQAQEKVQTVKAVFGKQLDILISMHTLEPQVEIAGGCSNKNHALRHVYDHLHQEVPELAGLSVTLTTCDTDSLFHPEYFKTLEASYNAENPDPQQGVKMVVWQPPLFYNWELDERPFFNRITALTRSMMMLGGLISMNLNPMSIFSYPLELGLRAGFINPRYGVDDIIFKVRCMCATNSTVPVRLLPVPVISGPTIGTTFCEEVLEWGRQLRRWIIGASESFHYFVIHWRGRPLVAAVWWFFVFFTYYAVLLCAAGILSVLASLLPLAYPSIPAASDWAHDIDALAAAAPLIAVWVQYACFAAAFYIDYRATVMLGVKERVHPIRNLIHWIVSPLSLLAYSVIAFVSIVRFVFNGKAMARHDMAAKEGFSASPVPSPTAAPRAAVDVPLLQGDVEGWGGLPDAWAFGSFERAV